MLDVPNPLTSTFIVGIACGICLAIIALWFRRRWQVRTAFPRFADPFTDPVSAEVDGELRARSRTFAETTGRPAAAPFVYSAIRDLAIVRGRYARRFAAEDEVDG